MNPSEYPANYRLLIDDLQQRPEVLAAILSGSRARGGGGQHSDTDLYIVVTDDMGLDRMDTLKFDLRQGYSKSIAIDLGEHAVMSISKFKTYGQIGEPTAWDRYAIVRAILEFDKSDGQVTKLFDDKQTLSVDESRLRVQQCLPGYLNYFYRSIGSNVSRNELAAKLDASQSISLFLGALFALHHRVTPYNKFLEWELNQKPLESIGSRELLSNLKSISNNASERDQIVCFRLIAKRARDQGFGKRIDDWGDKLSQFESTHFRKT